MDPRRPDRIRECPDNPSDGLPSGEQFNALGMVLSLLARLMKVRTYVGRTREGLDIWQFAILEASSAWIF